MCHIPNPALPRQSAQPAVPFPSELLGRAPRTVDLVKGACRTHGGECNAAHNARTLPMAGAQFKQNHDEIVKPTMSYHPTETVGYSE